MAQTDRRLLPTAGVLSLHLSHSMWISWWVKWSLGRFFLGVSPIFPYHKFHSIISPHSSHSFHFIRPCDDATGMVGWHPCYSHRLSIKGLHHISSLDLALLSFNKIYKLNHLLKHLGSHFARFCIAEEKCILEDSFANRSKRGCMVNSLSRASSV